MFVVIESSDSRVAVELCAKLTIKLQSTIEFMEWIPRFDVVELATPLRSSAARRHMEFVQMYEFDAHVAQKAKRDALVIVNGLYCIPNLHFPFGVPMPDLILYIEDHKIKAPDVKCNAFCKFTQNYGIRHVKRIRQSDPVILLDVVMNCITSLFK